MNYIILLNESSVPFPAAYFFSVFSGRDIIVYENSILGEMCNIVQCGFPLSRFDVLHLYFLIHEFIKSLSEAIKQHPDLLNETIISKSEYAELNYLDYQNYLHGFIYS